MRRIVFYGLDGRLMEIDEAQIYRTISATPVVGTQSNLDGCFQQNFVDPVEVMEIFDSLPDVVRDRINRSPFKICVACLPYGEPARMIESILDMEEKIRRLT